MDNVEIDRLRKTICRSFANSPHKKKYSLALLEIHVAKKKAKRCVAEGSKETATIEKFVDYARR
jgi:hypothetical protein